MRQEPKLNFQVLASDLETDWAPDPWSWRGYGPPMSLPDLVTQAGREPVEALVVPFVGGRRRVVPLLGPASQLVLYGLATRIAWASRRHLANGVFGYGPKSPTEIANYRDEYRRKTAAERSLARRHSYVGTTDVERFFPSAPLDWVRSSVAPYCDSSELSYLSELLDRIKDVVGHPLPEGYAASRAIANLLLFDVDYEVDAPFTRWIDDYRVFGDTEADVATTLAALTRHVTERTPFVTSPKKTQVMLSSQLGAAAAASMTEEHLEVGNVVMEFENLRADTDGDRLARERRLRHLLRLAAERGEAGVLRTLLEWGPELPAAAVPRLAWLISRMAGEAEARALLEQQLEIDDEYASWRALRLAAAAWYLPHAEDGLAELILKRAAGSPTVARASVRYLAKHAPGFLPSLAPEPSHAWPYPFEEATWREGSAELWPPPVMSFL